MFFPCLTVWVTVPVFAFAPWNLCWCGSRPPARYWPQRPALKYHPKPATDPHFKDYVLFHEYFHGDSGRGVGASHQTGWTGLVPKLIQPRVGSAPNLPEKRLEASQTRQT